MAARLPSDATHRQFGDFLWDVAKASWPASVGGVMLFVFSKNTRNHGIDVYERNNCDSEGHRLAILEFLAAKAKAGVCEHSPIAPVSDVRPEVRAEMAMAMDALPRSDTRADVDALLSVFLQHYHLVAREP